LCPALFCNSNFTKLKLLLTGTEKDYVNCQRIEEFLTKKKDKAHRKYGLDPGYGKYLPKFQFRIRGSRSRIRIRNIGN
jgi:hypothetical protein